MNNLRLWILLLALTCFGAGVGTGVLYSSQTYRSPVDSKPLADYHRYFVDRFELSPVRAWGLEQILAQYAKETEGPEAGAPLARHVGDGR